MRYIPPAQKEHEAYERGQKSMAVYIVMSALLGLMVGFFVGYVV